MTDTLTTKNLLDRIHAVLPRLDDDLAQRARDPGVQAALRAEHGREVERRRTADPLEVWAGDRVAQIAAAWMLSLLFARTLEDRGLIPLRLKQAADHRAQLRALAPYLSDRDYLLLIFRELTRYRGVRDVFDPAHNPVWTLAPSAQMAAELLDFSRSEAGLGGLDFSGDTRFLGDVYEQLNEDVRKRYALLQTPDFVESFILDRTLTPALEERGVEGLTLIDPTCGSGHFLLGAFARLRAAQEAKNPSAGPEVWAFQAVHQVYGVDINPYAVAIARFRLVLAYLDAAGVRDLADAGDLRLNIAVADSLLPVEGADQLDLANWKGDGAATGWHLSPFAFAQGPDAQRVLGGRSFDVVIGNPPYITVKDKARNAAYREHYVSAYRSYQLVVPFVERFFGLGVPGAWIGAIVGNGFMKREFGKKLIETFFPTVDLRHVVDTSGAFIPGHGTPTVIVFGRSRPPTGNEVVAVMGKRGEPSTPEQPSEGLVWSSIRDNHATVGYEDDFLSVARLPRERLHAHPWSLKGGGATDLKARLEASAETVLGSIATEIGFGAVTREDDVFIVGDGPARRWGVPTEHRRPFVAGENVRDWALHNPQSAIWPYDTATLDASPNPKLGEVVWPWKVRLSKRVAYGHSQLERGLRWNEYSMHFKHRFETPLTITFAFVATHNHFVLDRGGKVFNRTAPIIKLPADATEDDHLALLGYLNSSTACFWLKQVMHDKGNRGEGGGTTSEAWERFYEFDGTKSKMIPLPTDWQDSGNALDLAVAADELAQRSSDYQLSSVTLSDLMSNMERLSGPTLRAELDSRAAEILVLEEQIRWVQEELDWTVYAKWGLCSQELAIDTLPRVMPRLGAGRRPSDVRFAQRVLSGDVGQRYFSLCRLPAPAAVAATRLTGLGRARFDEADNNKSVRLIEQPEFKRTFRESFRPPDLHAACADWLLNEAERVVGERKETMTTRDIARVVHRDPRVAAVAEVYAGAEVTDLERVFAKLVAGTSVPFAAAQRYKPKGMIKFRSWETTWDAQRKEDAGQTVEVPLPPKYGSGDFAKPTYWRLRKKLDVPKERFISYPGAEDPEEPSPVIGWAGWDHADRMAALGALVEAETERERLVPLLAGMLELLPWVVQWHGDDMRYGVPLGQMWSEHLQGLMTSHGLSEDDLRAWRPPAKRRGRKKA